MLILSEIVMDIWTSFRAGSGLESWLGSADRNLSGPILRWSCWNVQGNKMSDDARAHRSAGCSGITLGYRYRYYTIWLKQLPSSAEPGQWHRRSPSITSFDLCEWLLREYNKATGLNCDIVYSIHPDLRSLVYRYGIQAGTQDDWYYMLDRYKTSTVAGERDSLLRALSSTEDVELIGLYVIANPWAFSNRNMYRPLDLVGLSSDRTKKNDSIPVLVKRLRSGIQIPVHMSGFDSFHRMRSLGVLWNMRCSKYPNEQTGQL